MWQNKNPAGCMSCGALGAVVGMALGSPTTFYRCTWEEKGVKGETYALKKFLINSHKADRTVHPNPQCNRI
jgi:hypothetical protein